MVYGVIVLLLTGLISFYLIALMEKRNKAFNGRLMRLMYFMHLLMSFVYYVYARFNASDSNFYYEKVIIDYRGPTWGAFYGTSTTFIEFIAYPFIRYMGFSYEAVMVLFSFFGFLGFFYFYIFFKENIKFKHTLFGVDIVAITFLLPNLHFWSASLGKGSVIFLGIGLFFYALRYPSQRKLAMFIGAFIIYHVRPHIMFVILVSCVVGFTFSKRGLTVATRVIMIIGAVIGFFLIYQDVLSMVGIDEGAEISQGLDLSRRAEELSDAGSGIDIESYSLPYQIFTFLFRPLFFDAPGLLGLVVSVENVFYLLLTLSILNPKGIRYLFTGNFLIKTASLSFITVSIALAQISGNLGIAIRQKSQVMPLLIFVICSFLDQEKMAEYVRQVKIKKLRQRILQRRQESQQDKPQVSLNGG